MKKITLAGLAAVFALILGVTMLGTQQASAEVTDVRVVGCELVAGGVDGDADNGSSDYTICGRDLSPAEIANLDEAYGDGDGELTADELDERESLGGKQIGEDCGYGFGCTLLVFVFVDDEKAVTIDPPAGLETAQGGAIDFVCDTESDDDNTTLGDDNDCDDTTPNNGDGVVVFHVGNVSGSAGAGDSLTVNVEQESVEASSDVEIVGTADDVTITLAEDVIQDSGTTSDVSDCEDDLDVEDALGEPNATVAIVQVVDSDGNPLARQVADISSDDTDIASIGDDVGITVVTDTGTAQYAAVCGAGVGETDIIADWDGGEDDGGETDTATITVVGEPDSIALTASPASIACDGTATSTVSATVTDADGNNVADGVDVNFSVVALGTANPINTTTTDGVATSVVTPLSNASAGVTVIVTSGDAQSSIRVDCSLPIPPQTPGPVATPTRPGGITGPDTGNGGYLGQDGSAGFPAWTLVALALGSIALVGGGLVTKKVSK